MNLIYYQDQLKLYWLETKRCNTYESYIIHGQACPPSCCTRIRITDEGNDKRERGRVMGGIRNRSKEQTLDEDELDGGLDT